MDKSMERWWDGAALLVPAGSSIRLPRARLTPTVDVDERDLAPNDCHPVGARTGQITATRLAGAVTVEPSALVTTAETRPTVPFASPTA
jgi:hypothetical protein